MGKSRLPQSRLACLGLLQVGFGCLPVNEAEPSRTAAQMTALKPYEPCRTGPVDPQVELLGPSSYKATR